MDLVNHRCCSSPDHHFSSPGSAGQRDKLSKILPVLAWRHLFGSGLGIGPKIVQSGIDKQHTTFEGTRRPTLTKVPETMRRVASVCTCQDSGEFRWWIGANQMGGKKIITGKW